MAVDTLPICVLNAKARLGEAPLWHPDEQRLYWLDLTAPALHRFDPVSGTAEVWTLPLDTPLGGIVRSPHWLFLVSHQGLMRCDFDRRSLAVVTQPNRRIADTVLNDCKTDRNGRLWLASKHQRETDARGELYTLFPDGNFLVAASGFKCANGPAFSPNGEVLYFADTTERRVYACNLDRATGKLSGQQLFAQFSIEEGEPDGLTVDADGGVWVCSWGGWHVTRFDSSGRRDLTVPLPVPNVTSCCFGGADLATLFITTASEEITTAGKDKAPLAGGVFAFTPGMLGLAEPAFRI